MSKTGQNTFLYPRRDTLERIIWQKRLKACVSTSALVYKASTMTTQGFGLLKRPSNV